MDEPRSARPDWDRLFETASSQAGYFTTRQGAAAGYSSQLLLKHMRARRVVRAHRGIYRLVHFPVSEHEDLVTVWLWSEHAGVLSHQTALSLHDLSDTLPTKTHLTLPDAWRKRRFRAPASVVLHYAHVSTNERSWFGPVPVTNPHRTLVDCANATTPPDVLRHAALQALHRGLVTRAELGDVDAALKPFGGLTA